MVLTAYFVLPGEPGFLVTIASAMRKHCRQLDISVGISGPHDFAVRLARVRLARQSVHRIPHPTFVTIAKRPSCEGGTAGINNAVSTARRSEIFLAGRLDSVFENLPDGQISDRTAALFSG
jgi:hypothetical protein